MEEVGDAIPRRLLFRQPARLIKTGARRSVHDFRWIIQKMRRIKFFSVLVAVSVSVVVATVRADAFDDAVNLYLKGFDNCSAAKAALASRDLKTARSEFARYETILQQAAAIDKTILGTSRRGMDSNLKYCERVGTDIEIEVGRPLLEQALVACDKAIAHLNAGQVEPARAEYQRFAGLREQALQTSPALNNVFSLRSEIRRCERVEPKIASFGQQQAALTVALQSALDSSEAFQASCEAALDDLNRAAADEAAVDAGRKARASAQARQKDAHGDYAALKAAAQTAVPAERATIENRIAKGNQCLTRLESILAARERQLRAVQEAIAGYLARVNQANESCMAIRKVSATGVSQAQYDQVRSSFEAARKTRDEVKAALGSKSTQPDHAASRRLDDGMRTLDACLEQARPHLNVLLAALTSPAVTPVQVVTPSVATPAVVVSAARPEAVAVAEPVVRKTQVPALEVDGTLDITDILPDFVLVYWRDGSAAPAQVDVLITPTRFDQPVYVLRPGGTLQFRSEDFAAHMIDAIVGGADPLQVQIKSRQRRTVETRWPENSIATLRSDQSRVVQSFIVSIPSSGYSLLRFDGNDKSLRFKLKNPRNATEGVMLMPDYDPVQFDIGQGDELRLTVTRSGARLGVVALKGH